MGLASGSAWEEAVNVIVGDLLEMACFGEEYVMEIDLFRTGNIFCATTVQYRITMGR